MKNCDICANDVFRDSWKSSGVERRAFDAPPAMRPAAAAAGPTTDQEALVQAITERVMAALAQPSRA
jgi:L-fuculose-phosphate aldolase